MPRCHPSSPSVRPNSPVGVSLSAAAATSTHMHVYVATSYLTTYVLHQLSRSLFISIPRSREREGKRDWIILRRFMASSDKSPSPMPSGAEHPRPPGQPMTVEQHMIDKGAQLVQSLKPVKQMNQHVCTFALYSHDMSRQIETHHYLTRVNQDFLQCAVYDSDHAHARLIGLTSNPSLLF